MLETLRSINGNLLSQQIDALRPAPAKPAGDVALDALRRRNAALDGVFYDVGVIQPDEAVRLSPWSAGEGAILIVPPSGQGAVSICPTVDDFIQNGGPQISTLAVAGVGSSGLGSAAYARNIADALGKPVAAVVSGYGLADLMTEAIGGYFLFGQLNGFRHAFEYLDELRQAQATRRETLPNAARLSLDTRTVLALVTHEALDFRLLTGHSKGNLVISEALYELVEEQREVARAIAPKTQIVTVSAKVAMPPVFKSIIDVMGQWDWFGGINSRGFIKTDVEVPGAWHHTNTQIPAHVPVRKVFAELAEKGALAAV